MRTTRTQKHRLLGGVLPALALSVALLVPGAARADGVLLATSALPQKERAVLVADIAKARRATPHAFSDLAKLRAELPQLDAQKRGTYAPITPILRNMGPEALLPMLEHLAVAAPQRGNLTDTAWTAWRVGLLEAVGALRDPRAEATLMAIVDGPPLDFEEARAAAAALGKLGTDEAADKLVALAEVAGPKQRSALAGMGACRREVVAIALSDAIDAQPREADARLIIRSLGNVGSRAAWATPIVAASGEESQTRQIAADALVRAFVMYEGETRKLASHALMVVDDPSTPDLIAAAKQGAPPMLAADLDRLAMRFADNPTR